MEVLEMVDKTFAPQVEVSLVKDFTKKCNDNKVTTDDAISQLIQAFLDGAINITTKTVYTVAGSTAKPKTKTKKAASTTEGKKRGRKPKNVEGATTTTESPVENVSE
jgi:uncharacterized membrane protein